MLKGDSQRTLITLVVPKGEDATDVDTLGNAGVSNKGHIAIGMDLVNDERTTGRLS